MERGAGLYIHVPFCGSICSYCHFARTDRHDPELRRAYVRGVARELELRKAGCGLLGAGGRPVATCYIGGGTPSCLEPELMEELLASTLGTLPRAEDLELTAEANPETFTDEVAAAWSALGIGRISLGVQSLDDRVLALLGRRCDGATALAALGRAGRMFGRVSADWILGPQVEPAALCAELDRAIDLGVGHFSLYILEVHAGTPLQARIAAGRVVPPPDEDLEAAYLRAGDHLEARGFVQYEVANFARPGAESRHNRAYWRRRPYLGLGPGAHGAWADRRYGNHRDLQAWLAELQAGRLPEAEVDPLDLPTRRLERVMLALRTREGVPVAWLPDRGALLERGRSEGLWRVAGGRLALTRRGFLRIDGIEEILTAHR